MRSLRPPPVSLVVGSLRRGPRGDQVEDQAQWDRHGAPDGEGISKEKPSPGGGQCSGRVTLTSQGH